MAQQLGLQVSKAHKPSALHHEGSLTEAVALQATDGWLTSGGSSVFAICLLEGLALRLPLGVRARRARRGGVV